MKALNKAIRFVSYMGVYALTAAMVYLLALLLASPVCCLVWAVADAASLMHRLAFPMYAQWLAAAAIIWIPLYASTFMAARKK
jgi:hypothetical protein